jgi:hypothetical protein
MTENDKVRQPVHAGRWNLRGHVFVANLALCFLREARAVLALSTEVACRAGLFQRSMLLMREDGLCADRRYYGKE